MHEDDVEAVEISDPKDTLSAVQRFIEPSKIIGLDVEWDSVSGKPTGGEKAAILQLTKRDGYCAIFRLDALKGVPEEVVNILEDPDYIKLGVDPRLDAEKLYADFNIKTRGAFDIRFLARKKGLDAYSLARLTSSVFAIKMKKLNYSNVYKDKIHPSIESISGVLAFVKLNKQIIDYRWNGQWKQWTKEEFHRTTVNLWKPYFGRQFQMTRVSENKEESGIEKSNNVLRYCAV